MLSCIRFESLLNTDGDPDCPWPTQAGLGGGRVIGFIMGLVGLIAFIGFVGLIGFMRDLGI